jgi:cell division protein FtsL
VTSRRTTSSRPGDGRARSRPTSSATPTTRSATRATTRAVAEPDVPAGSRARARLTGRAAVLLLVLAVLAVSYASSTRAWLRQRNEIADLTAQIKASQAAIDSLQQERRRWSDPAYVKAQARERFGWVMPGETGYRVIGDDGHTLAGGANQLAEPVAPTSSVGHPWWQGAWSSVVVAGQPGTAEPTQPPPPDKIGGGQKPPGR